MLNSYLKANNFDECINYAIYNLNIDNLYKAIDYIHEAMIIQLKRIIYLEY